MVELRPESQINLIFNSFTLLSLNFFHSYCSQNMLPHTTLTYITLQHCTSSLIGDFRGICSSPLTQKTQWRMEMNDYSVSYCRLLYNKLIQSLTKENNNHFTSPNFFFFFLRIHVGHKMILAHSRCELASLKGWQVNR